MGKEEYSKESEETTMTPKEKQKLLSQLEHWLQLVRIRIDALPPGWQTAHCGEVSRAFQIVIRFLKEEWRVQDNG